MPEKPEVVTVCRSLESILIGQEIRSCHVYWPNIIASPSVDEFQNMIVGQKIEKIQSRGKFIILFLTKFSLLIHLRMEGKFLFRKKDDPIMKHEHVEFLFSDGTSFRYHDVRKFGKMYLLPKEKTFLVKPLSDLGLEYNDSNLTRDYFYQKIHMKSLPIKTVLLDQSIIAGIGNIYDDEILFLSKISPLRKASDVTVKECQFIIDNCKIVLNKAISLGGTTIKSFTSSEGVHGLFQNELLVHGKKGEKCPYCNCLIQNIQLRGRGTYYCPNCQK